MEQIYLDHTSNTPLLPEVREAMAPYLHGEFANPSSLHRGGRKNAKALEEAREKTASLIGARGEEIIFTSCGTEANNFAMKGLAAAHEKKGRHIVVSSIEHFSILHAARRLERQGYRVTRVPVDQAGWVDPQKVREAIAPDTVLISIMHANGEVGTLQSIREIAQVAQEHGILFHTDAVSSCGTIPTNVSELGVAALTLTANQFYGPVGAAALYVRKGTKMLPFFDGGGQEEGRRSGTENLPAIVGMGKAAELALSHMEERTTSLLKLRNRLMEGLISVEEVYLNGHPTQRLPGHVSISVAHVESEPLLLSLDMEGISVASGSACNSKAMKSSHVLQAMGVPELLARGTVVLTLGIGNREEEISVVLDIFPKVVERLRKLNRTPIPQEVRSVR
ncbi:MAG: cysteine desulfurase [Candidatus Omnitrophica bacterium]|nr:cysteine desulfurase [Candidatus Omnitrophota bacterium]